MSRRKALRRVELVELTHRATPLDYAYEPRNRGQRRTLERALRKRRAARGKRNRESE